MKSPTVTDRLRIDAAATPSGIIVMVTDNLLANQIFRPLKAFVLARHHPFQARIEQMVQFFLCLLPSCIGEAETDKATVHSG